MTKIFAFLSVLYEILLVFFCEFTVKTTEHTVASYESKKKLTVQVYEGFFAGFLWFVAVF
jgi:hypothetical protein